MPKQKSEAVKRRLIAAAIEVVGSRGFRKTTVPLISKKAGVSTGTFYIYFKDKSRVFVDAIMKVGAELKGHIDRVFQERLTTLQERGVQTHDVVSALADVFGAFFDYVDNYRSHFLMLFLEGYSYHEDFASVLQSTYKNLAEYARLRIIASEQLGVTRQLSLIEGETISWAIVGMLSQTAQMYISGGYNRDAIIKVLVDFTWNGLKRETPRP